MKSNPKGSSDASLQNINMISSGTRIKGDIEAEGDIRMDGSLEGNIITKGRLVIGSSGQIRGEIDCSNVEISGKLDGKIVARELLSLKSTAVVSGEIHAPKLSVEPGAIFTGTCRMGSKDQLS